MREASIASISLGWEQGVSGVSGWGEGCLVNTYIGWGRFERVRSRHDGTLLQGKKSGV